MYYYITKTKLPNDFVLWIVEVMLVCQMFSKYLNWRISITEKFWENKL